MQTQHLSSFHVEFGRKPLRFDSRDKQVFYDEVCGCIMLAKKGDFSFVSFRGVHGQETHVYRSTDAAAVFDVKLSPDNQFLAIQRTQLDIEFVHLPTGTTFTQQCRLTTRSPNSILGFFWPSPTEVVYVTTHGLEHFKVEDSKALKNVKTEKNAIVWFVYSHRFRLLITATNENGTSLQQYYFMSGQMQKLSKIEVGVPKDLKDRVVLSDKDVVVAKVYGKLYIMVTVALSRTLYMYALSRESAQLSYSIPLHTHGTWAVSVVDSVIVAHNRDARVALLYDVKHSIQMPVGPPLPFAPLLSSEPVAATGAAAAAATTGAPQSPTSATVADWLFLPPNLVLDKRAGLLLELRINLEEISASLGQTLDTMVMFLLRRANSVPLLLRRIKGAIEEHQPLSVLARLFDILNDVAQIAHKERGHTNFEALARKRRSAAATAIAQSVSDSMPSSPTGWQGSGATPRPESPSALQPVLSPTAARSEYEDPHSPALLSGVARTDSTAAAAAAGTAGSTAAAVTVEETVRTADGNVVVDQADLYRHVFLSLDEEKTVDSKFMVGILLEFVRSLSARQLPVHHYIYELIIDILVKTGRLHQLHQFLQYHAVSDSYHVACQLLALSAHFAPATQLALDMLRRLDQDDTIVEVLLSRGDLLTALRFVQSFKPTEKQRPLSIACHRFLEAACATGDDLVFYNVYEFLEQWLSARTAGASLASEPGCAIYVERYRQRQHSHTDSTLAPEQLTPVSPPSRPLSEDTVLS